jgi:hypothetical protein
MVGRSRASGCKVDGRVRWGWEERAPDDEIDERHRDFTRRRRLIDEKEWEDRSGMMRMLG